jgi:hypothetical protein
VEANIPNRDRNLIHFRPVCGQNPERGCIRQTVLSLTLTCILDRMRASMTKQITFIAYATCMAVLVTTGAPIAHAIQCHAAPPTELQTHWTYRLVDDRKCWYEGRNRVSRSLLHWSADPRVIPVSDRQPARLLTANPNNPLSSQARVPDDPDSFESLWRERAIDVTTSVAPQTFPRLIQP